MSARQNQPEPKITMMDPALIDPFAKQARRTFDPVKLQEMANSLKEHGMLQPMVARPSPLMEGRVELIAGERRLRGARMAGLAAVPVILRELSDLDAEEISLTENLQREDLNPVEEADGIWRMLELRTAEGVPLYTQESLAAKLGKPVNHIKDRVKLRACPETMLKAVEEKVVGPGIAAIVGRIPDAKARELATKQILKPETQSIPLRVRQATELVRANFMAKITTGGLVKPDDATLLPVETDGTGARVRGGACTDCPFRSGNNADLAGELSDAGTVQGGKVGGRKAGIDPWLCTKPSCLTVKQTAAFERLADEHLARSPLNTVLSPATAKREISPYRDDVAHGSAYVMLNAKPEYHVFRNYDMPTWAQLIKGLEVGTALARHPETGKVVYLLDPDQVKRAKDLIKGREGKDSADESDEDKRMKARRAKELREEKVSKLAIAMALNEIRARVSAKGLGLEPVKAMFTVLVENAGADGIGFLGRLWGLEKAKPEVKGCGGRGRDYELPVLQHAETLATTVNDWLGLCLLALVAKPLKWGGMGSETFQDVVKVLEIDLKGLQAMAAEQFDREQRVKAKGRDKAKTEKMKGPPDGMGAGETLSGAKVESLPAVAAPEAEPEPEMVYDEKTAEVQAELEGVKTGLNAAAELIALIDQASFVPTEKVLTHEERVAALEAEWQALKKPGTAEGADARKQWDKERKRITRALAKLGVPVPAKDSGLRRCPRCHAPEHEAEVPGIHFDCGSLIMDYADVPYKDRFEIGVGCYIPNPDSTISSLYHHEVSR